MKFNSADVTNIIQASQRDEAFVEELQEYLTSLVKCFGQNNYNQIRKLLPCLTTAWYYLMTSLSNLQTLGEEYAGLIRLGSNNKIPAKYVRM